MSQIIPEKYRDLFNKSFYQPRDLDARRPSQVTPVWCDVEGDLVIINSAKGRQKDRNLRRDPRVSLAIIDPQSYRYLGSATSGRNHRARRCRAHRQMAKKYLGVDKYPYKNPNGFA
jgi:hypothetical protein